MGRAANSASVDDDLVFPYPGSVEHVGMTDFRGPFFFGTNSLVKTFTAREHGGAAPQLANTYAEPVVHYVMTDRKSIRTGEHRSPVPVFRMNPGGPSLRWDVGALPIGTYMLRLIGAIPTADVVMPPRQLVFQLRINDRLDGSQSVYVLRARGVDSFYCLQEFGFHVVDGRKLNVELSLLPDSQTTVFLHNLEIHDILGGCARRAGKTMPALYTLDERDRARQAFARTDAGKKMRAAIRAAPRYNSSERQKRDEAIWNSLPPLNAMVEENYVPIIGRQPAIPVDTQFTRQKDKCWVLDRLYGGTYGGGWDQPFEAVFDRWDMAGRHRVPERDRYSLDEYLNHQPLGNTGDRGWGILTNVAGQPVLVAPICRLNTTALQTATVHHLTREEMDRYYLGGDETFARDMAFYLCRYAWFMPAYSLRHCVEYATWQADIPWMATRFYQSKFVNLQFPLVYDKLLPFIRGNEELARAVGRFIPWVRAPEDIVRLLDTHLVQYMAKNMEYYRYYYDEDSGQMMLALAAIQADPVITKPWMEWLWTRVYYYPLGQQPLPDVLSINTQRDGSSPIGSTFYSMAGGPAVAVAKMIEPYLRTGGYREYDLSDIQRYPKAVAGCYFPLESTVAGQWSLGVGDVGGPSIPYGEHTEPDANAEAGWQWTHDPAFAWLLLHLRGREGETDAGWSEITRAAQSIPNPILTKTSRVLSDWSGILESGAGQADFRFHRAAAVRVGRGHGHAHNDGLDLRLWAHGLILSGDFGQRGAYGKPTHAATLCHNVVQIDDDQLNTHSWVRNLADLPGAPYLQAEAVTAQPGLLRRQVALIDVDEGKPSRKSDPAQDPKVITPDSYVFDVMRAAGGHVHTYCFHGCVDDGFEANVQNRRILPRDQTPDRVALEKTDPEARFLEDFRWTRPEYMGAALRENDADWLADAPTGILQATWRLARPAESRMVKGGGAMTAPRKFTRLHLFNPQGMRVLHGIVIDKNDGAKINPEFPHYAGRCLFTQKRAEKADAVPLQNVFTAVIEPYAGEPFILARSFLNIAPNEDDALKAVAVEVKTRAGRTDVCFADGRPERTRQVPEENLTVAAEFALLSRDNQGLVRAALNGGTLLQTKAWTIRPAQARYEAAAKRIDFEKRRLTLDTAIPAAALKGAYVELGDHQRRTSYLVSDAQTDGATTQLSLRKSIEKLRTSVTNLVVRNGRTLLQTHMGGLGNDAGLWVANGNYSKFWRLSFARNDQPVLDAAATENDFSPDHGRVYALEIGPGAHLALTTFVCLSRVDLPDGPAFQVRANVPFTVESTAALSLSSDGKTWTANTSKSLTVPLSAQSLFLRGLR